MSWLSVPGSVAFAISETSEPVVESGRLSICTTGDTSTAVTLVAARCRKARLLLTTVTSIGVRAGKRVAGSALVLVRARKRQVAGGQDQGGRGGCVAPL